jgi:hypothetical protein
MLMRPLIFLGPMRQQSLPKTENDSLRARAEALHPHGYPHAKVEVTLHGLPPVSQKPAPYWDRSA